jgi:thioredoxin-related protein
MDYVNICLWLIGVILSWLFTHIYYKKSLRQQAKENNKENKQLLTMLEKGSTLDGELFKQQLIEKALEEFLKKGTPVNYIDTLDLSNEEKADIYDKACLRKKGRLPKNNPYKIARS